MMCSEKTLEMYSTIIFCDVRSIVFDSVQLKYSFRTLHLKFTEFLTVADVQNVESQ